MKQKIEVKLTVEFPDDTMQPDVNEAIVDAIKSLKGMLSFIPSIRGKTSKGKVVAFKVVDVEK
jgi:hypothetical protein